MNENESIEMNGYCTELSSDNEVNVENNCDNYNKTDLNSEINE